MAAQRPDRAPVMHDVARLAGVSHQTVSRVLNDHPHVREETRRRVEEAIATLGYRPNAAARTLVTSRTRTLGVVAAGTTLFGPASTMLAIEQAARSHGYSVTVASLPDLSTEAVSEAFGYLESLRVAGVVVIAPQRTAADAMLELPADLPVVAVDGGLDADLPIVCVDQAEGARLMTEHLLALGHRTVHHVAGPADWLEAEERVVGWRQMLEAAGRPVPEVVRGDWSARSGYERGRALAADPDVTAVFTANDQVALGVLRALEEAGRRVPGDVSVGGFDDVPEAEFYGPGLTSVRQGFGDVGERSIATLLSLLEGRAVELGRVPSRTVAPRLVRRRSTAPPPPR
ncbi:LacI family DNA-binding transcriptional regulator [Aquipuribacter sp. SD81]|uniref:LacI family DNA-binding transcriptional regulator n=1 Tax=Aquipuribacter sp. SD81 TaxID=3127703 RepID=UPI003016B7F4